MSSCKMQIFYNNVWLYTTYINESITIPKGNVSIESQTIEFVADTDVWDNSVSAAKYNRIAKNVELLPMDKQLYSYGTEGK